MESSSKEFCELMNAISNEAGDAFALGAISAFKTPITNISAILEKITPEEFGRSEDFRYALWNQALTGRVDWARSL